MAIRPRCQRNEINRNTPSPRLIAFDRNLGFVNQSHRLTCLVLDRPTSDLVKYFGPSLRVIFPYDGNISYNNSFKGSLLHNLR